jgi:hypothetical protein
MIVNPLRSIALLWRGGLHAPVTWRVMLGEHKLLVGPPMPDRSKGRSLMKFSPWSSRWRGGCEADDLVFEKFTFI